MGRRKGVPGYCLHRASGQAVVRIDGRDHYLGPYNSPGSRARYAELIARHAAGEGAAPPASKDPSVNEMVAAYLRWAEGYYRKNGRPTKQLERVGRSLAVAVELYGSAPARQFGPQALARVRDRMVEKGWSRRHVNSCVGCVRRCWKWAVAAEMVPAAAYQALLALDGLRAGKTAARETPPTVPVGQADIDAALPWLRPVVADMVRLQRLTGMRAGEVCAMTPGQIDRGNPVWLYRPEDHKNAHRGRARVVLLGPRAQALLAPYLDRPAGEPLFSPAEDARRRYAEMRARRRSRVQPCQEDRSRPNPRRAPGDRYTTNSYNQAIRRACRNAGITPWRAHQLRHAAAREFKAAWGIEVARQALGHHDARMTEHYAGPDLARLAEVVAKTG